MASIWLAGEDRTPDLLPRLQQAVGQRDQKTAEQALRQATIPALKEQPNDAAELDQWLALLRAYGSVRTDSYDIPARPGLAGRLMKGLKQVLWKLLQYQHDRMAVQQHAVNLQLMSAIEAVLQEQRRENLALRERVAMLEKRLKDGDS